MASMRTNAAFMNYLEKCATEGAVYGDKFFHCSARDADRYYKLKGERMKPAQRTIMLVSKNVLEFIAERRAKTAADVARTLTK